MQVSKIDIYKNDGIQEGKNKRNKSINKTNNDRNLFNHVDLIFVSSLNPIYKAWTSLIREITIFKINIFFETPGQVIRFCVVLGGSRGAKTPVRLG